MKTQIHLLLFTICFLLPFRSNANERLHHIKSSSKARSVGDFFIAGGLRYKITSETIGNKTVTVAILKDDHSVPYTDVSIVISPTVIYNSETYNVTSIGYGAFYKSPNLVSITIPNSVKTIEGFAFEQCPVLVSVNIPSTLTTIGEGAFTQCEKLASIALPNSLTSIGNSAFFDCKGLSNVIIPNSITTLSASIFQSCGGLLSITISTSVTSIQAYALEGCSKLTSINIPNSVTSVGYGAFENCSALTSFTFPNSVLTIDSAVFAFCTNLTTVTIPSSVISIGSYCFQNCNNLANIYANNPIPVDLSASTLVFNNVNKSTCVLHVPVGAVPAYQAANQWKDFSIITETLGTNETSLTKILVYPNPAKESINIRHLQLGTTIKVLDLNGREIYKTKTAETSLKINTSSFQNGLYFIKTDTSTVKFLIKK